MIDSNTIPSGPFSAELLAAFIETAHSLYASEDLDETLGRVTAAAVDVIGGCDLASVSSLEEGGILTRAATGSLARDVDAIQYASGEGPCLDAAHRVPFVYTADMAADHRWPRFSDQAAAHGIKSLVSCRLAVAADPDHTLGSINLYGRARDAFDPNDRLLAMLFAAHATVVLDASRRQAHLRQAMESRDVIGQAKGILMSQTNVTSDEAFDQLRRASQRMNVKLRDLAERVARNKGFGFSDR
jgi:GAF domain-containing protein